MKLSQLAALTSFALGCIGALLFIISDSPHRTMREAIHNLAREIGKKFEDKTDISGRLKAIDQSSTFMDFRAEQIINMASAFIGSFTLLFALSGGLTLSLFMAIAMAGALYFISDWSLSQKIEKNRRQMESEFPAVVELFSLALSAGLTPAQAMFRISERSTGILSLEFSRAVKEIRDGSPFHLALDAMGRRMNSLVIRRFIDALVIAVVRGAPLVEVLQRHALESRNNQKNEVMAKAGKAEISMMIPIVFLILPISIVFALWPSLSTLNLFST